MRDRPEPTIGGHRSAMSHGLSFHHAVCALVNVPATLRVHLSMWICAVGGWCAARKVCSRAWCAAGHGVQQDMVCSRAWCAAGHGVQQDMVCSREGVQRGIHEAYDHVRVKLVFKIGLEREDAIDTRIVRVGEHELCGANAVPDAPHSALLAITRACEDLVLLLAVPDATHSSAACGPESE